MLSGERAFTGDDVPETLAVVTARRRSTGRGCRLDAAGRSAGCWRAVSSADAARRLRDIGEARIVLDDLASGTSAPSARRAELLDRPLALAAAPQPMLPRR